MIDILNIDGKSIPDKIEDAIENVRKQLPNLTTERTCIIYSEYMKKELDKLHTINRIIRTKELDYPYNHHFNIVIDKNSYYIVDLTYKQFQNPEFLDLIFKGYQEMSENDVKKYLEIVGKEKKDITKDNITNILEKGR